MNQALVWAACLVFCVAAGANCVASQMAQPVAAGAAVKWSDALEQAPAWYASDEAARIADNVLLYQRETGGWHKNIDMAAPLDERQRAAILREKGARDSTIDNGATFTQLTFLARVYTARKQERHREAFLKGVHYLLRAQYANGGWPQYYPDLSGYHKHITYNDGAMIGVMKLLRDIAARKSDYVFVDEERRAKAESAVQRGIECVLKTQVVTEGRRTIWGAQHDEVTLAPAPARKFEPVSLASSESVGIVRFLMGIKNPNAQVIEAIEAAIAWFEKSKVSGIRWAETRDALQPGGFNRVVVKDPQAPPLWARFYEIGSNRPIFSGRDGVIKYDVSEIEAERRNGYAWYVNSPAKLIGEEYPAWRKKLAASVKTGKS
jgi:PelA/Pel-15E family pectate lyase